MIIIIVVGVINYEIFYLTTHSTYFNTVIWRRTYGRGYFFSDIERGNPLTRHRLLFSISSKDSFTGYAIHLEHTYTHTNTYTHSYLYVFVYVSARLFLYMSVRVIVL